MSTNPSTILFYSSNKWTGKTIHQVKKYKGLYLIVHCYYKPTRYCIHTFPLCTFICMNYCCVRESGKLIDIPCYNQDTLNDSVFLVEGKNPNNKRNWTEIKTLWTLARGANTPICPMNIKQFIQPCDRKTLNEDDRLSTEHPQFHDDWCGMALIPTHKRRGQLTCVVSPEVPQRGAAVPSVEINKASADSTGVLVPVTGTRLLRLGRSAGGSSLHADNRDLIQGSACTGLPCQRRVPKYQGQGQTLFGLQKDKEGKKKNLHLMIKRYCVFFSIPSKATVDKFVTIH